ncbi:DUF58 domain-containing protein [Metallumcola ferriviriculae]|uniref:DUF58 domain-containing protein n=1 Tax=Metallumcola ferriviriculae TaxID=3039180 RepID=A0AAU0UI92_9FIRM|nr:DUF58 domain-containing protein [Desulfitibacteraceae bacterium MK1]
MADVIFDKNFLRALEKLMLMGHRTSPGRYSGQRRSARRGDSVEFADFKAYAPGDDFRHVDWNAYARMEKLFLKLFLAEQDTSVRILLDCSASMAWKDGSKFRMAKQLAGALGYLSLANYDRVTVIGFGDENYLCGPLRGKGAARKLFNFIEGLPQQQRGDLFTLLEQLRPHFKGPGITLVISDLFFPVLDKALAALKHQRQEIGLIQILHPLELNPDYQGDLQLLDCETGNEKEISFNSSVRGHYQERLEDWRGGIKKLCHKYSVNLVDTASNASLEELTLKRLRKLGFLG